MSETVDFIEMKIPAKPEYIGVVRLALSGVASRMGFSYDDIDDLKVALSEAVTNAVQHAYENSEGEINIRFDISKDSLKMIVKDRGKGFDFKEISHKTKSESLNLADVEGIPENGFGLLLIESLMDEVSIRNESGGVKISMLKHLVRDGVARSDDTFSTKETN